MAPAFCAGIGTNGERFYKRTDAHAPARRFVARTNRATRDVGALRLVPDGARDPESDDAPLPSPQSSKVACGISTTDERTCSRSYCRLRGRGRFQSANGGRDFSMALNDSPERRSNSNATCSTYPTPVERSESAPKTIRHSILSSSSGNNVLTVPNVLLLARYSNPCPQSFSIPHFHYPIRK
jgi:hypothetical protein